jgi:hypothetical protein
MEKGRGGYCGKKIHALKFRATPELLQRLRRISDERKMAMAWVIRDLITWALKQERS